MMHDVLALLCVLILLGGIMAGVAWLTKRHELAPELSRKSGHVLMGLACLTFPWVFSSAWPVVFMGITAPIAFIVIRSHGGNLRSVFHGVKRRSYGELLFPLAVMTLYLIQQNPLVEYLIPLLVLTLADAMSALVGVRFGKTRYTTDEGHKSWEGSLTFFLLTCVIIVLPLFLWTDVAPVKVLLIAPLVAAIVMLIEAVAWRGLDNLFIPLVTYLLLTLYTELTATALAIRLLVLVLIVSLFWLLRKRTYARDATLLASGLCLYIVWFVGGWPWAIMPLTLLLGYCLLCPPAFREQRLMHGIADLGAVAGAGMIWLFLSVALDNQTLYWLFTLSWPPQLAMIACARFTWKPHAYSMSKAVVSATALTAALYLLPLLMVSSAKVAFIATGLLIVSVTLTAAVYWHIEWQRLHSTHAPGRPLRQLIYGSLASCAGLAMLSFL